MTTTLPQVDRRRAAAGVVLPASALESGYWECNVDGQWMPYPWPTCSIIEQAFCRFKISAEFPQRGMNYRLDFRPAVSQDVHTAAQVNSKTGMVREVRRWPSKQYKAKHEEQLRAHEELFWSAWVASNWAWLLFDAQHTAALGDFRGPEGKPHTATPAREVYSFGAFCLASAGMPELLHHWPLQSLACAVHPLGRRCNFSMQRLTAADVQVRATATEWQQLCRAWQDGGLAGRSRLVGAYRIQNRGLLHGFLATKQAMLSRLEGGSFKDGQSREPQLSVRMLWHGTKSADALIDICSDGFDRACALTCAYGKGCYFAAKATYSDKYACDVRVPGEQGRGLRAMLLSAVVTGELVQGTSGMYPAPVKPHSKTGERFENTCDNVAKPGIFVTFKDHQALPAYVVVYELSS